MNFRVHWDRIQGGRGGQYGNNFEKTKSGESSTFGVSYDYLSVMHYPRQGFGKTPQTETITPKQKATIGQRDRLSAKDVMKVKNMYKCSG